MTNSISMPNVSKFELNISKSNTSVSSPARNTSAHIHDTCEIYVNISGNVSFMVEKNLYPIQHGDIIISKPYEYHHCIYHDSSDHHHYWITFSSTENQELFSFFLGKKRGENNLIRLPENILQDFLKLCDRLAHADPKNSLETTSLFFALLSYIETGLNNYNVEQSNIHIPQNFLSILNYVNKNFTSIKSINEIADTFDISITTLERYFKKHLNMTPRRYLEDKKLFNACKLLRTNYSVIDACFESGFCDYSHFITIFKRNFNTTPLKYKKNVETK